MRPEEYYEFEERAYENPTKSMEEQTSFIDNLREIQAANNAQIKSQTENLGTQIPSVKGGLTGSEGYFQQRYQTTPTNTLVADLRAAAQADALNKVMNNYSSQLQQQYNDAYRKYQKNRARRQAAANRATYGGNNGTTTPTTTDDNDEQITPDIINTTPEKNVGSRISTAPISGWSDTSFTDTDGRVHRIYTQGGRKIEYINNEKVFDNTDPGIGAQGGGSW